MRIRAKWFPWTLFGPAIAWFAAACGPANDAPVPMGLQYFRQQERAECCVNETLSFHFTDRLDRASITSESVQIRGPGNLAVRGRFTVRKKTLEFVPDLPRAADLGDGGLRPGTTYNVRLLGFPSPDALRSETGAPLARTYRSQFRTAAVGGEAPLFVNPFTEMPTFLAVEHQRIDPFDPIVLECGEALDPTSVAGADFMFMRAGQMVAGGSYQEIPLLARLLRNAPDEARIELRPRDPDHPRESLPLAPGAYYLHVVPDSIWNLGGRIVPPNWVDPPFRRITVRSPATFDADFSDPRGRSPRAVPGVDGTAAWGLEHAGRPAVGIRFPAAAGDGRHGVVGEDLATRLAPAAPFDLHADRLSVPEGTTVDLSDRSGLVILRSQGSLVIDGDLRRALDSATPSLLEHVRNLSRPGPEDSTLTSWLAETRAADPPWTVLIAGGDLRVSGRITVEGPLVLVAGGWIRVAVAGRVEATEVWMTADGGGDIRTRRGGGKREDLDTILTLDPPLTNLLRQPLRLAILSHPIHPPNGVERWGTARIAGGRGDGDFALRFLGETANGLRSLGPVDELGWEDLDVDAVRLWIELLMPAGQGEPWDPPHVDDVRISWKEPAEGGQ